MPLSVEELNRLLKLIALGQAAFLEAMKLINQNKQQSGQTTDEIFAHAEQTNKEAQDIINSL